MRNGTTLLGTYRPRSGKVGAGGYVTRISFANDGKKIIGTDTFNGYLADAGTSITWDTCLKPGTNCNNSDINIFYTPDGSAPDPWGQPGAYDVAIAPSNSSVAYLVCLGRVWVTQNGGALWTRTSLSEKSGCAPNEPRRMTGKSLVVDPQNPAVCFFAAPTGLVYTVDYGANWSSVSTGTFPLAVPSYAINYTAPVASILQGQTVTGATSGATGINLLPTDALHDGTVFVINITGAFISGEALKVGGVTKATSSSASFFHSNMRTNIAFDPSSSVTSGKKQGLYALIPGYGLYHSTNGGAGWSKITDRPTAPYAASHMKVGSNGYVYLTGGGGEDFGQFSRWNGSAWLEPTGITCKTLAISPHNAGHIYICGPGGSLGLTKDYGATFELSGYMMANRRVAPNIPWQAFTNEDYMSNGDMEFDPVTNRLWVVQGIGVWYMNSPPTTINYTLEGAVAGDAGTATWTECSVGIENMVTFGLRFAPNGSLGYSCGDRSGFVYTKARLGVSYAGRHPTVGNQIQNSCGSDWAPEDNNFFALATYDQSAMSVGFTTDGGETFTMRQTLAGTPGATGLGGNIVCFTKDKWILVETNRGNIFRTSDRGLTWTRCIIGTDTGQDWHQYVYFARRVIVRDETVPGRAFAYNNGWQPPGGISDADRGIWRTDDYGATWTKVFSGSIINYGADFYNGKLTQYAANSFLWCGGNNALGLWKTTDGCVTWAKVTGSDDVNGASEFGEVYGVGVAKGAAGSGFPSVLAIGFRQVTAFNAAETLDASGYGLWHSLDGMATWKREAVFFGGNFDCPTDVAGDPSTFARHAVGMGGSGFQLFDYSYTQRWT